MQHHRSIGAWRTSDAPLVGIGLFGFTLSWDETKRSSQAFGRNQNTLTLEPTFLTTPVTNPAIHASGR